MLKSKIIHINSAYDKEIQKYHSYAYREPDIIWLLIQSEKPNIFPNTSKYVWSASIPCKTFYTITEFIPYK